MRWRAHAKVNLGLRVLDRRPDGYHDIESLLVSVDLHDVVTCRDGAAAVAVTGPEAEGVPEGAGNLAWRALGDAALYVAIEKHIPSGAGLGGASADAAAVLHARGLAGDLSLAAALGADVPFCVRGGAAQVAGIGDVLGAAPVPVDLSLVLVVPAVRLATAAVYAEWDAAGPGDAATVEVPGVGPVVNDLAEPAMRVEPALADTYLALERVTARPWLMTGSGSGLLLPLDDADEADAVARRVGGRVLQPVDRGVAPIN
jgi:4-diphosphocytidyl-2-C-methyl-D-erythritol kinase